MDPITIGMIGAGLFGGASSFFGARSANKANLQIAREQMAFQERMSNTSHQREAEDLRRAGLNPIMTATGGAGASTPSGASATMQNVGESFAKGLKIDPLTILSIEQGKANIGKTEAETLVAGETAENLKEQNKNLQVQNELFKAQTIKTIADATGWTEEDVAFKIFGIGYEKHTKVPAKDFPRTFKERFPVPKSNMDILESAAGRKLR